MRSLLAEYAECKLHAGLREISRHCSHRLLPGKVAPFRWSCLAGAAQSLDSSETAACCILSRRPLFDFGAVHQSIREPNDAYRVVHDCSDLRQPGVGPFVTWPEWFATRRGAKWLMTP